MTDRLTDERLARITDTGWPVPDFTPDELRAHFAELLELRQRIATMEADRTADGFGLQGLTAQDGTAELTTIATTEDARHLVKAMSVACGRMLDADQATNYIEFEVIPAGEPGYVVHIRRAGGPSPHTLRREAEDRAAKAEATLAAIKATDPVLFDPTGGRDRGAADEAYGSAGEDLRHAFCAAVGIDLDAIDREGFDD